MMKKENSLESWRKSIFFVLTCILMSISTNDQTGPVNQPVDNATPKMFECRRGFERHSQLGVPAGSAEQQSRLWGKSTADFETRLSIHRPTLVDFKSKLVL